MSGSCMRQGKDILNSQYVEKNQASVFKENY